MVARVGFKSGVETINGVANLCSMAFEISLGERISTFHPNRSVAELMVSNSFSRCSSESVLESAQK